MSNIDKQALRQTAEKAISEEGLTWWNEEQLASDYGLALHRADAAFIAAANPVTMLALLDELEESERLRLKFQEANCELCQKLEVAEKTSAARLGAIDTTHKMFQRERGRAEVAEKRIAELEASHSNLREAMAGIHNTITGGGAYTPLAAILNASKRTYEESAAAAGKGEAS